MACKMKDGRITQNGSEIPTEEIAEWTSILCNGEDVPEDNLEEVNNVSNEFSNLRL
jgi:hypothetical protein